MKQDKSSYWVKKKQIFLKAKKLSTSLSNNESAMSLSVYMNCVRD